MRNRRFMVLINISLLLLAAAFDYVKLGARGRDD